MTENDETIKDENDDLLSCPFCFSDELEGNVWRLGGEEIDAIECKTCLASAPISVWQNRGDDIHMCPACSKVFVGDGLNTIKCK